MGLNQKIDVRIEELGDTNGLKEMWLDLQARAQHSFFQSWMWIDCWLRNLPQTHWPKVLIAASAGKVVGLGLFSDRELKRRKVIRSRTWSLHETGDPRYDVLMMEYNGILVDRNREEDVLRAVMQHLTAQEAWDELVLSGINPESPVLDDSLLRSLGLGVHLRLRAPSRYVDIREINESGSDYLSSLSSNTRYQLRRALREYEKRGSLQVTPAKNRDQAFAFLEEMMPLHQKHFIAKGHPGAFANTFYENFHRCLIAEGVACGAVQLLQIAAGTAIVGYLYNFIQDGVVYNYQCGFHYEEDPKIKPGLVSHFCAIDYYRRLGMDRYDLLAIDSQYKRSLTQGVCELLWVAIQRDRLSFRFEKLLRWANVHRLRVCERFQRPA